MTVGDTGAADAAPEELRKEIARRVDAIEAAYEFLLAYAAQGLTTDSGAASGQQLREHLRRFDQALVGIADQWQARADEQTTAPAAAFADFLAVLATDAASTRAALGLLQAQPGISSQLVDNFNASIHVRALLTDVFLIDEALK